jgi:hypothetical protein
MEWLKRGWSTNSLQAGVPTWCPTTTKEVVMNVMIGVDPHKASHTAVAIDGDEDQLSSVKVRVQRHGTD